MSACRLLVLLDDKFIGKKRKPSGEVEQNYFNWPEYHTVIYLRQISSVSSLLESSSELNIDNRMPNLPISILFFTTLFGRATRQIWGG